MERLSNLGNEKQKPPEGGFLIWCIFPRLRGNLLVSGKSAFPDLLDT